jgi:hypothetical protein
MYIYSNFQVLTPETVFKTKNAGESRLLSRLFLNSIHKHSFGGLVPCSYTEIQQNCKLTCKKEWVYPVLVVTNSKKSRRIFKISGIPSLFHEYLIVSMEGGDSRKGYLGRYPTV